MKEKGQSLVELAITFVMLMYLLGGAVEFGILFFQYVQLRDAVQEGALYGSMYPNDIQDIEYRVRGASSTPIDLSDDSVSVEITMKDSVGNVKALGTGCEADAIEVRAIFQHKIFMPFIPALLGTQYIPLNAKVIDTVLYPICKQP